MKMSILLICSSVLGLATAINATARDLFALTWSGTFYSTNQAGQIVSKGFSERDVVAKIAADNSLNPSDCVLVYRPDGFDTAVVLKTNGQVVADYQQIPDITQPGQRTDMSNTNGTETVRQAFLFDEDHGIQPGHQIGSIFGMEKQRWDANGNLVSENFHGTFQFAIPETDGRWQQGIYAGTFATGRRIVDTSE